MIRNVFLDVDGTIANFTDYVLELFDRPDLKGSGYPKGVYCMEEILGITKTRFWNQIDNVFFWASIPRYPGAVEFVSRLKKHCDSIGVKLNYCTVGNVSEYFTGARADWLKRLNSEAHVDVPMILMSTWQDKELLAKPGALFIDDNDNVCEACRNAGASIVRVPQRWNGSWGTAKDSVDYEELFGRVTEAINESARPMGAMHPQTLGDCRTGSHVADLVPGLAKPAIDLSRIRCYAGA